MVETQGQEEEPLALDPWGPTSLDAIQWYLGLPREGRFWQPYLEQMGWADSGQQVASVQMMKRHAHWAGLAHVQGYEMRIW